MNIRSPGCCGNFNCFISQCKVTDISYTSTQFNCLSVSSRLVSLRETSTKRRKRSLIETAGITFPKTTNGRALCNHAQPFWPWLLTIVCIFTWTACVDCCEWQHDKPVSPKLLNGMETSSASEVCPCVVWPGDCNKKVNVSVSSSVTDEDISRTHIPLQTLLRRTEKCLEKRDVIHLN